jgi:predicted O-methyltransferase YrrM
MGTCVGISAAYQAAALELNGAGKLLTLEGAPAVAALARQNLSQLGLQHRAEVREGRFQDVLAEAAHVRAPLDLVFVDGHHDGDATLAYFKQLQPHLSPGGVIVFDDIAWSPGMRRAWERIAGDEIVSLAADLGEVGLVRTGG